MTIAFMKWHGAGNDFVMIDSRGRDAVTTKKLAAALGDRNRGVGFDQLAEIRTSDVADIDLDFWNADGSRAGACGNATRCVARYMLDQLDQDSITIRTSRGILHARADGDQIAVNMGHPQTLWNEVPVAEPVDTAHLPLDGDPFAVGMGNPHCVFFVDDADSVNVAGRGAQIEHHPLFPERTNVEFASIRANDEIRMRVWERGAGITLACGSGACATAVAAHARGLTGPRVRMELDGGWLTLEICEDGVWMTGPTAHVFTAELTPTFLKDL